METRAQGSGFGVEGSGFTWPSPAGDAEVDARQNLDLVVALRALQHSRHVRRTFKGSTYVGKHGKVEHILGNKKRKRITSI